MAPGSQSSHHRLRTALSRMAAKDGLTIGRGAADKPKNSRGCPLLFHSLVLSRVTGAVSVSLMVVAERGLGSPSGGMRRRFRVTAFWRADFPALPPACF